MDFLYEVGLGLRSDLSLILDYAITCLIPLLPLIFFVSFGLHIFKSRRSEEVDDEC